MTDEGVADADKKWVPSVGDIVRVKQWNRYIVSFAKKIADRDAVVVSCSIPLGCGAFVARVRFLKRNGRGKEFEERFRVSELIPWAGEAAETRGEA